MNKKEGLPVSNLNQSLTDNLADITPKELFTFITPEEFIQESVTNVVLEINDEMEESISNGKTKVKLSSPLNNWIIIELKKLNWEVKYESRIYVLYMDIDAFEKLEKDATLEKVEEQTKPELFMTPYQYYKKVKEVQIQSVKEKINVAKNKGVFEFNIAEDTFPSVIEQLRESGWTCCTSANSLYKKVKLYEHSLFDKLDKQAMIDIVSKRYEHS